MRWQVYRYRYGWCRGTIFNERRPARHGQWRTPWIVSPEARWPTHRSGKCSWLLGGVNGRNGRRPVRPSMSAQAVCFNLGVHATDSRAVAPLARATAGYQKCTGHLTPHLNAIWASSAQHSHAPRTIPSEIVSKPITPPRLLGGRLGGSFSGVCCAEMFSE